MPSYAMRSEGVPTSRPHYGDTSATAARSNAAAAAAIALETPDGAFGGDERTYGAPGRVVAVSDPLMANYLPSTMIPSRWAPPVAANTRLVTITTPAQSGVGPMNPSTRPEHIPVPATQTGAGSVGRLLAISQGGKGRGAPQGIATPTPAARPRFRLYGPGNPTT